MPLEAIATTDAVCLLINEVTINFISLKLSDDR